MTGAPAESSASGRTGIVPKPSPETLRVRRIWDEMAPNFDKQMRFWERVLFSGGRQWACSQAQGKVLEIAVGTGLNLTFYPEGIELTGIDYSPSMLDVAKQRARDLHRDVDLLIGDAQALDLPDDTFDTVVCTLSLCSIPDDSAAVQEAKRVLRPSGRLILMEHVGSPNRLVRAIQRLIDVFTVRFEGDHQVREPLNHLRAHGLEVEQLERSKLGIVERVVARKPLP